jgi:long-subunit fatty acid transport protein
MEPKDIIGKEFTCFKFKSDSNLSYTPNYDTILGKTATVVNINSSYPQYANVKITTSIGKRTECHFPTKMIIEQLEQLEKVEYENKSVEELLNDMKQLISTI